VDRSWHKSLHWSPTGKQLLVRDTQGDLFLLQANSKGRRLLARKGPMVYPCMPPNATCTQWSPDGKRLALWLGGRPFSGEEGQGLARFLPPVGKEDAALPDAELIERYFQRVLSMEPAAVGTTYDFFLQEYVQALVAIAQEEEAQGKEAAAEEQYRKGLKVLHAKGDEKRAEGRGVPSLAKMEGDLKRAYAAFLHRYGREAEAAEVLGPGLPSTPDASGAEETLTRLGPGSLAGEYFPPGVEVPQVRTEKP